MPRSSTTASFATATSGKSRTSATTQETIGSRHSKRVKKPTPKALANQPTEAEQKGDPAPDILTAAWLARHDDALSSQGRPKIPSTPTVSSRGTHKSKTVRSAAPSYVSSKHSQSTRSGGGQRKSRPPIAADKHNRSLASTSTTVPVDSPQNLVTTPRASSTKSTRLLPRKTGPFVPPEAATPVVLPPFVPPVAQTPTRRPKDRRSETSSQTSSRSRKSASTKAHPLSSEFFLSSSSTRPSSVSKPVPPNRTLTGSTTTHTTSTITTTSTAITAREPAAVTNAVPSLVGGPDQQPMAPTFGDGATTTTTLSFSTAPWIEEPEEKLPIFSSTLSQYLSAYDNEPSLQPSLQSSAPPAPDPAAAVVGNFVPEEKLPTYSSTLSQNQSVYYNESSLQPPRPSAPPATVPAAVATGSFVPKPVDVQVKPEPLGAAEHGDGPSEPHTAHNCTSWTDTATRYVSYATHLTATLDQYHGKVSPTSFLMLRCLSLDALYRGLLAIVAEWEPGNTGEQPRSWCQHIQRHFQTLLDQALRFHLPSNLLPSCPLLTHLLLSKRLSYEVYGTEVKQRLQPPSWVCTQEESLQRVLDRSKAFTQAIRSMCRGDTDRKVLHLVTQHPLQLYGTLLAPLYTLGQKFVQKTVLQYAVAFSCSTLEEFRPENESPFNWTTNNVTTHQTAKSTTGPRHAPGIPSQPAPPHESRFNWTTDNVTTHQTAKSTTGPRHAPGIPSQPAPPPHTSFEVKLRREPKPLHTYPLFRVSSPKHYDDLRAHVSILRRRIADAGVEVDTRLLRQEQWHAERLLVDYAEDVYESEEGDELDDTSETAPLDEEEHSEWEDSHRSLQSVENFPPATPNAAIVAFTFGLGGALFGLQKVQQPLATMPACPDALALSANPAEALTTTLRYQGVMNPDERLIVLGRFPRPVDPQEGGNSRLYAPHVHVIVVLPGHQEVDTIMMQRVLVDWRNFRLPNILGTDTPYVWTAGVKHRLPYWKQVYSEAYEFALRHTRAASEVLSSVELKAAEADPNYETYNNDDWPETTSDKNSDSSGWSRASRGEGVLRHGPPGGPVVSKREANQAVTPTTEPAKTNSLTAAGDYYPVDEPLKTKALTSKEKKEIVGQINRDAGNFCPPQTPSEISPNDITRQIFKLWEHRVINVITAEGPLHLSESDQLKCLLDALPPHVRGKLELSMNPVRTLLELSTRIEHLYPWSKYVPGWGVNSSNTLREAAANARSADSTTINQFLGALEAHRTFHQVVKEVFNDKPSIVNEVEALNIAFAQDRTWNSTGHRLRNQYPDDAEYLEHGYTMFQELNAELASREHFLHRGQLGTSKDRNPPKPKQKTVTHVRHVDMIEAEPYSDGSESFYEDYEAPPDSTQVRKVRAEPPQKSPSASSDIAAQLSEMKLRIQQLTGVISNLNPPEPTVTVRKVDLQSRMSAYQKAVAQHEQTNPQTDEAKAKTEELLRKVKNPDLCFGFMDYGKCSNPNCLRNHICRNGVLHERPAITDFGSYRIGCDCCSWAQYVQAYRANEYTIRCREKTISYKEVRKPPVLTETEVGKVAEDCTPVPYAFDTELGVDLMQLRERWLKLVGKTGITPVVTPPAAPEVKAHRISPIPNAPALNTASSTVRIETTVPGGGFFTRFVPSEALPPGDDIELKLVPFGPGNPFRKPPDTVRLLNLDKLREETKQKIRIMSVQNSTPEETINMDNAVGMSCTKATIGKIQVIVSWDPGSGVSWITPSLIALLKHHEVPFYTVRVRDGRVGGWGGAQTTVLTAYYVWVRMGAGTKLLRLYLAPDAETDALRNGIMIGRDFNEEVGVQTIDGNSQLFPDDHHTITLADYGKVRVRLTMLDEKGIQQWTQSPVTVNGQVKTTNITVIPPLESRIVNTTLRVNPDKVQYLDDTGKRPPLTVLVTPNSLNPSDHGLVVKGDRPNVVFCSTLITVQNTMVVSEDWELMVIPEPPEGFNCTHESHHGITCPRHTKDPGDPHGCDFLPVALTQDLEVHNPHDTDVVLRPGEILGEATVGLHAQLQINAVQTPAMPSEQSHETLQLIPLREALSVAAVLEEGVFGQVVNTLMAFLLLGSMMIFQGGVDVVLMAVGMLPSQPDVGDLLAWVALFLTVTAVVFFSTCATLIPLRHTSLAQWWARWGAPSVMIPVTALVQETVHQVAPAHEGYWPVDCVLSLCTFLVLWWVWRALWTQLCTSGQRPRNLPPPSRSLWTAGNGAKPSSKAWSIPFVSLKYLLVLLALWVPFHHTNHSAWQYHRDSPVKVGNIALVSPPLTNVDVPDEPPEPEPPAWTKVTEEYNAGSFWTKDESTFLSGLQWYQRLSELGENISPTQFREAGDTLLGFRTLGDPVDFARESIPPLEHPDGTLKDALTIDTGDAEPIRTTPYPCGPKKKLMISTEIDRLVSQGICKRMCSPWGAPVVCVPKKDGTVRFCVSYVKLNAVTKRDAYPLHRFDSLPAFLRGKSIFSTLDLQQGFHQMPLHPDDQLKTAFVSHRGQFVFTVCPFGLTNAPATFQRMMDQVIGDLLYDTTFVFIDDSITASSSFDQHLSDLREVLSRYDANDLKVKLPKCYFFQPDIDYLGHNFDRMGVRPMYRNLQAISDFATPASVKDVRSFLGVIGYYREHMRSYASVAAPLFKLLKKGVVFNDEWGEPHVEAFRALKRAVAQKPMLRYPDPNLPFICSTDTSDYATGAVLSQEFPVAAHPDACQVQAKVTAEQSKMFEEGWYTKDALFHPTHCQGNFQVGERLFHSVKQYIAFKKARYFLLDELADKIAQLIVTPEFENELSRLTVELEETLLKVEFYSEESWGLIEVQEWYSGTLAKFYCQPSYMDVLLQYKTVLRSKEGRADSMSDFALHAVQCRLRRLTEHLPLPEDRPVFERHPIAFYSSTLSPAEAKYDARERECLGVLRACEKFEFYTYGCPQLIIENDHLNLTHLYNDHEGRLLRWSWRLQRFAPFLVVHTPGKLQHVPDGLSRYLTSHYNTCDLKDMLYGAEEAYRPPFPEVLKVLADRLPESVTRCYDPISCHPETPKLWEELGISTLDSTDINFFDQDQRPSPTEYDAVITHGPYANIGTTVLALLSLDKPFAMLVPTLAITRPDSFLHLVQDLKLLLVSTVKQYSQRSKRDVPLHHVWVTKGLLKDQLEIVPLEPLDDTDGRAPERIEVVEPFLSLRDIKGFLPTDPDLSRSDMLSDSVVQFTKSNSIRPDLNEIGTRSDARQVPEAPWAKVAKLSVQSSNGPAGKSGASQSVSGENYFPNDYPGLSTVAQDALTAAISTSGYRVPSTFAIRKNYSRKAPIQYEVEETLEHKIDQKGKRLFLVKWKDCPATDNTWEPEAGLSAFTLQTYWDRVLQDQNDLLKPDNIAKVLPAKHFPDDEVKKASAGLKQFKQDRDKQIAELEQELTEATDSNHSAKKLTDYARARIEDTLALLKDSEAEVEDVDGYEDSLYPPDPEPKHMSFPRLQQFRTAQMSDLVLGELIGAQTLQEVDPADSKEEVEYYLVCKGQHPVKNSLLLLKQKAEIVIKAEDPLTQLSPTKYGLLTASSEQEAARLVTRMMVQAQNPTTNAVAANRFKRKCVQLSNDGPKFHYLEVQLTRNETEDLSIHERFAHVTWRTAKQISQLSSKQLTTNGDEVNTIRYTKATTVLTCALRDSTLHNSQKSFPANLVVKEGLLYYVEQHSQKARLVVPRSLRLNLLFIAHDSPTSGHRGAAAVLRTLQNRYWWPQMRRDIFHYCKGCLPCNQSKATSLTRLKYMQPYAPCERGHMIHIDHFGPFPPSADGNTVVLSVIDRATSYCWAYACKDSTSETVAEVLYQRHFLEHGYPVCIVSDNGPAFASELIAHLDRICEVKHLFTTPYRPQSNGKVERIHRVFKAALQMYVDPQHSDWDKRLASIVYAMRTTPQDSEIYTPFFLWHGRHPVTPLELLSGHYDKEMEHQELVLSAMQTQLEAAKIVELFKRQRDDKAQKGLPQSGEPPDWENGQMVLVKRPRRQEGLATKLLYQWVGPYIVRKRITPVNYSLDLGNGRSQTYHVSRLHDYYQTTHPVGKHVGMVDLFDIESVEMAEDVRGVSSLLPLEPYQLHHMLLFNHHGEVKMGRIVANDTNEALLELHLYDTVQLDNYSRSVVDYWPSLFYPLYLTPQNGVIVRKLSQAAGHEPVVVRIHYSDVVDVPFTLKSHKLKKAQLKILHKLASEKYDDVSAPLWA